MTECYALFACDRYDAIKNGGLRSYMKAATSDLQVIGGAISRILDISFPGIDIEFLLEHEEMSFRASASKIGGRKYIIRISLGLLLGVDDFSGVVSPYYADHWSGSASEDGETFYPEVVRNIEDDQNYRSRFVDYSWLNVACSFGGLLENIHGSIMPSNQEKWGRTISNLIVCAILFHECGHVLMGHCDMLGNDRMYHFSEEEQFALSFLAYEENKEQTKKKLDYYYAREFQADEFSASLIFEVTMSVTMKTLLEELATDPEKSTFFQAFSLSRFVCCYAGLLIEKASATHANLVAPSPMSRVFNMCALLEQCARRRLRVGSPYLELDMSAHVLLSALMHLDYMSYYLGLRTLVSNPVRGLLVGDCEKWRDQESTTYTNAIRESSISILVTQVINYSFGLNLFTHDEDYWGDIDRWHRVGRSLAQSLEASLMDYSPVPVELWNKGAVGAVLSFTQEFNSPVGDADKIELYKKTISSINAISRAVQTYNRLHGRGEFA